MTVVRVLGALGKTVIAIGLIILLFGIFQLWGTGVIEARAQQGLDSEFNELLEASNALEPAPSTTAASSSDPPANTEPSPTVPATPPPSDGADATDEPTTDAVQNPTPTAVPTATAQPTPEPAQPDPEWLAMLYRDWGSAIARIQIPSLGVDKTVVEGVRVSDLRKGPGHYSTTPMPGQAGNAAIAGHRTTYGAPFGEIDKLLPGDQIIITTIQGEFTYEVVPQGEGHGHIIVAPTAVEVLDQDFSDHPNRITLTACHPKGSARQRIIVVGALVGEPAPTYARPGQEAPLTVQLADENLDDTGDSQQTVTATPVPEASEADATAEEATPAPGPTETTANATPTAAPADRGPEPTADAQEEANAVGGLSGNSGGSNSGGNNSATAPTAPPPPSADSFGEGLDGDADAWPPAILWGLAALAIWIFALFAGHRWRKLPAYSLSALPFLVVLFMAFWHIDRIIPSY